MEKLLDDLSERTDVAENVVQILQRSFSEIDSRQRNLDLARESVVERMMEIEFLRESYEKGLKDLEEKQLEFCSFKEGKKRKLDLEVEELCVKREELLNDVRMREEKLDEQLVSLREQIERLEVDQKFMRRRMHEKLKEIKTQEESLNSARELVAERERKVEAIIGKLDERIQAVEERENELNSTVERKMGEMVLKEEQLSLKWQEFVKEVKLADEKFRDQEKLKNGFSKRLELAEYKLESMRGKIDVSFEEIESRENVVWESVARTVKRADLIRELLERELNEFEKTKREFESFAEDKMRELVSKEEQLNVMSRELVNDAKLRDEQLTNQEKLGNQLLKKLEAAQDKVEDMNKMVHERFNQVCLKEIKLESVADWVERKKDEIDSKRVELEEYKKMKREFHSFQEDKIRELIERKQQLNAANEELVKDADLTNEEKLGSQLLKRLESAHDNAQDSNKMAHERLKQICLKEIELKSLGDWVERKLDEVDTKGIELEVKEKSLLKKEDNLMSKEKELDLKEKNLESWREELKIKWSEVEASRELNGRRVEELDSREKSLNSVREFTRKCFKEHVTIKKQLLFEKDLAEKRARDLDLNESADLKFILRMDGKTLQMFLNDPEKDLESMSDEIFKVLHLSSDPAKLVLDAMVGFYPPHLRKGDVELNVRRTCIILLEQFFRMSKNIQPRVKEQALQLAGLWKSKMRADGDNPLEALGFLHLLAAYDLASYFEKHEVLSFLMTVAQHRERPQLCRVLGFAESFAKYIVVKGERCTKAIRAPIA
ncbi:hypothetical protein OROHE_005334 [Orobanche hederae]